MRQYGLIKKKKGKKIMVTLGILLIIAATVANAMFLGHKIDLKK